MPVTSFQAKAEATRGYDAEVRQYGKTFDDANKKCFQDLQVEKNVIFVPPLDDLDVMAGQGTIALEIYEEL